MNALFEQLLSLLPSRFARTHATSPVVNRVRLGPNDWRSIHHPSGLSIRCLDGQATVTQEGDPRDLLLVAGETFDVSGDRHLYLTADRGAELLIGTSMAASSLIVSGGEGVWCPATRAGTRPPSPISMTPSRP